MTRFLITNILGYAPKIDVMAGLEKTIRANS
jgi:hypothetical protein